MAAADPVLHAASSATADMPPGKFADIAGTIGGYRLRMGQSPQDLARAQALRQRAFELSAPDRDAFDALCSHLLVEDAHTGRLVGACRVMGLPQGGIAQSYSAQFYDLTRLAAYPGPILEIGRFAIAPDCADANVPRLVWAALTRMVDMAGFALLFGCSSFAGTDPAPHSAALANLALRHQAPPAWRPDRRAPQTIALPAEFQNGPAATLRDTPPLLRSYLAMGGWVSDHAVVDHQMNTLHVFTGVEVARIPPSRARALRALAGQL